MKDFIEKFFTAENKVEFSRTKKLARILLTSVGISLTILPSDALAKTEFICTGENQTMHIKYETDGETRSFDFRIVPLAEGAGNVSPEPPSELFQALQKTSIHIFGVNTTIADGNKFKRYIFDEASKYGFSEKKLPELQPQDAIRFATLIVARRLRYSGLLLHKHLSFDPKINERINNTTIDQLVMNGEEAVCRHLVEGVIASYNNFAHDARARLLHRTLLKPVTSTDEDKSEAHGVAAIIQDTSVDKKNQSMTFSFLETVINNPEMGFEPIFINAYKQQALGFEPIYDQYLKRVFDPKLQIDVLTEFIESEYDGKKSMQYAIEKSFVYSAALRDMQSIGKTKEADELFQEFWEFSKKYDRQQQSHVILDEYDLLHSVFFNIYKGHADAQKNPADRERVLSEGEAMRLNGYKIKYDALLKTGDIKKALKVGEDYADFQAQTGDTAGAEKFYHGLLDTYQQHASEMGAYERSMPRDNSEYALFIKIEPFKDEASLQKYLHYKKERIWTQK